VGRKHGGDFLSVRDMNRNPHCCEPDLSAPKGGERFFVYGVVAKRNSVPVMTLPTDALTTSNNSIQGKFDNSPDRSKP